MGNILNWYRSGGPLVAPLIVIGVAGLIVLVERFLFLVLGSKINARPFIERVLSLVRGDKVEEALQLCAQHESALPDLGLVLLRSRTKQEHELVSIANAALLTARPLLTRRLSWLPALAKTALLLGALGFVVNLLTTIAPDDGQGTTGFTLFWAMAFALRPLAIGILTAIPLVLGHAYLTHEAEKTNARLEEFAARLMNALTGRPDVRLGHRKA